MNILYGSNAQGKTNFIEAIWICTGCRSFRGTKEKDYIGFSADRSEIELDFMDKERHQNVHIRHDKGKKNQRTMAVNRVRINQLALLFGNLNAVVFTPEDLELAKGCPETRRYYMNTGISQIHKGYHVDVAGYNRAIANRNAVIKDILNGTAKKSDLDIWDNQLARFGASITYERSKYISEISKKAVRLYSDISSGREKLELFYMSSIFRDVREYSNIDFRDPMNAPEVRRIYEEFLHNNQDNDIRAGMTVYGIHRDDIITRINNVNSREFGSQGQSRSIALIMKLAQAQLIWETAGDAPIILLDDVLSELDPSRQEFVLRRLNGFQVFVTCCDRQSAARFGQGKIFYVENGTVREVN